MDLIRLLLAALVTFGALLASAALAFNILPKDSSPILVGIVLAAVLIGIGLVTLVLFNLGRRYKTGPTLEELEAGGLVVSTEYKAKRAFEVEEFEDEGLHYFIELADGSVLYLNGQYLYEYQPGPDGSPVDPAASFPNTDFTVRRHRTEGYVLDILCRGSLLKPELVARPFAEKQCEGLPEDGQIIRDCSYNQIKAECSNQRSTV
jgi:hypothetical protein